jgi:hypothetical protein
MIGRFSKDRLTLCMIVAYPMPFPYPGAEPREGFKEDRINRVDISPFFPRIINPRDVLSYLFGSLLCRKARASVVYEGEPL